MTTDTVSDIKQVEALCPNCHSTTAEIVATVHSGLSERHFLECSRCHQNHLDSWSTVEGAVRAPRRRAASRRSLRMR